MFCNYKINIKLKYVNHKIIELTYVEHEKSFFKIIELTYVEHKKVF